MLTLSNLRGSKSTVIINQNTVINIAYDLRVDANCTVLSSYEINVPHLIIGKTTFNHNQSSGIHGVNDSLIIRGADTNIQIEITLTVTRQDNQESDIGSVGLACISNSININNALALIDNQGKTLFKSKYAFYKAANELGMNYDKTKKTWKI